MSAVPFPRSFSLLTPLLWVAAMFLLLLAVRSVLQNRSSREEWDRETIEWGRPRPSLIQRWRKKMDRIRFRLPRFSQRQMPEISPQPAPSLPANAPADPPKKPTQPMLALFGSTIGAPETKPKEAFAWEKTKGIE
jgi:heme/copper-type cytochrome/quinol oxidase subunit 1